MILRRMIKKRKNFRKITTKNNAGFTLIEVILSMAILAIVTIPLLTYFTDSMKYSAKMAVRQKATALAQELTEGLKAEDQLLVKLDDGAGGFRYGVKCLEDKTVVEHGYAYSLKSSSMNPADGTGAVTYQTDGLNEKYHVEITVSTNTTANAKTRPITYGINNICDVLAVENEQYKQAVSYFLSINSANFTQNTGVAVLTEQEVKDNMSRKMYMDIVYTPTDASPYYVQVYYIYSCEGLNSVHPRTYNTEKEILADIYMSQLNSIYLLYDQLPGKNDKLEVKCNTTLPENPILYLVCQNPAETTAYRLEVTKLAADQKIRSNISENGGNSKYGGVYNMNSSGLLDTAYATGISEDGSPVRLVDITATVYEKNSSGDYTSETPIISISTTKGD